MESVYQYNHIQVLYNVKTFEDLNYCILTKHSHVIRPYVADTRILIKTPLFARLTVITSTYPSIQTTTHRNIEQIITISGGTSGIIARGR